MCRQIRQIVLTGGSSGIGKSLLEKFSTTLSSTSTTSTITSSTSSTTTSIDYSLILGVLNSKEMNEEIKQNNNIINKHLITIKELNLNSFSSISSFCSDIQQCHLLINCAGIMNLNYEVNEQQIEKTMCVNYLGHFLLTNLLLPIIKQTSINDNIECRIINVTSSTEKSAKAFPGTDWNSGKSALRGELPDSIKFKEKISTEDTFYGLLSDGGWIRNGPYPYFMQTAYSNSSLCIILATIQLSHRLNPSFHMKNNNQKKFSEKEEELSFALTPTALTSPTITSPTSISNTTNEINYNRHKQKNKKLKQIRQLNELENKEIEREEEEIVLSEKEVITTSQIQPRITVNAVCPGYVNTPFWSNIPIIKYFGRYFFKSSSEGAKLIYELATSSEYEGVTGQFYTTIKNIQPSKMTQSTELAEHIWNQSCEIVGIPNE